MPAHNPAERSNIARIAALTRWSKEDPQATAERGQQGLRDRFVREVRAASPDLAEREIRRRADCAYRAHMSRVRRARALKARPGDREAA